MTIIAFTGIFSRRSVNPETQKKIWNLKFSGNQEGIPILWLHGFLGSHRDWLPVVEDHFRDYYNILPDLPGHGESKLQDHTAFPAVANDLFNQISQAGVKNFIIIGYSMGGRFGLHFQKRYPCHVDAFVGISSGPGLRTEEERQLRQKSDEALISMMHDSGMQSFLRTWYESPLFQSIHDNKEIMAHLLRTRMANDPEQLGRSLGVLGNGALYSLWDNLADMDLPVLLASGGLDTKYCEINAKMGNLIQGCVHNVFEGVDHAFHIEKPLETALLIRNFLRNMTKGE